MEQFEILQLHDDLIINIFEFCDRQTLGRLACTCKKFRDLIYEEDICWIDKTRYVLGSNMTSLEMKMRTRPYLNARKRSQVSLKWKRGEDKKSTLTSYVRCQPWIYLDRNYLYCSKDRRLVKHYRSLDGNVLQDGVSIYPHNDDVSRFVLNQDEIVTVSRNGLLGRWKQPSMFCVQVIEAHRRAIYTVDAKEDIIVSGSRDQLVKIWKTTPIDIQCQQEIDLGIRVLSLVIMPSDKLIVGTAGTKGCHPLQQYDLQKGKFILNFGKDFKNGAGIMDIYQESHQTFLSCGYDTYIRLWDIRTPLKHVSEWMEPYDNGIYCVRSDHNVTILSGCSRFGVMHLWDKRTSHCRHMYRTTHRNSAVYSVAFDAAHLFGAFDKGVVQYSYI